MGRGEWISGSAGGLRRSTDVSMVEATDFAKRHDPAGSWPFDRPPVGRVLVEREMRSCAVIVREVRGQDATEVAFAQNEDMIEALAPDRTDEPFHERILPGALGGREHFADPHPLHSLPEGVAVDRVTIAEDVGWRGVVGEGLHELPCGPGRGGMLGHVEVDEAPTMVGEHDQDEEDAQAGGGDREEIEGDEVPGVVGEERPPSLRRRGVPLGEEPGDGAFRQSMPNFKSSP